MLQLVAFLVRDPALTRDEFETHWRQIHGPLIRDTRELSRHILRYEQHPPDRALNAVGGDWDGVAIQWFASADDFLAFLAEPAYIEVLQPDEQFLLDMDRVEVMFVTEGRVVIGDER
ncbi:MAG TPA: EthD domain-containing protein [Acidimicrobiales bacterium]|nr:EthD domain-containing protein [Acidimicrobiales bacterium]